MKRFMLLAVVLGISESVWADEAPHPDSRQSPSPRRVQYAHEIQPILSANCFLCHGPDARKRKAGLRLDLPEAATAPADSGERAIVPGNVEASELIVRILATDGSRMPPRKSQHTLSESEKLLLKRWVAEGAEYQKHWAFLPPQRPSLPLVTNKGWVRNPIDAFLLARLEAEGLQPAPEADRYTLARRAAIDLTGLPPPIAAVDQFVNDSAPDAYEKYVERLFAMPAFGERWAQVWLDLARYADSNGYAEDRSRTIWRYRDWVIDALNANMPFDQFTIEQLAGDLLPNPNKNQLLATAFHRNTLTNTEGGTSDEEFRVVAVVDRVNTTMQVWMGLTLGCAQCHDHKYDPFTQEEYFRLYAFFNQTEDADRPDNSPLLSQPTPEQAMKQAELEAKIAALEKEMKKKDVPEKEQKQHRERLADFRRRLTDAFRDTSTPIMRELADGKKRRTHIHVRGNFLNQGKEVSPGVPAVLPPLSTDLPPNRLALAHWLIDPKNPLTARVAVNRYWGQVFGVGLVETAEDFGIRGKPPTHPDLLDWLAVEFFAQRWDVKKLLRLMVTSAAYRQSARLTPEMAGRDPDNRWLSRGPRFRSSAEVIRDQAMFASGLLSSKIHGPPVRPPQPKFGLTAAFGGSTDWETSTGEDRYRRAVYTQWRRSRPYPSMVAFDAPERTVCTMNRPRTNTPLQALATMNDPVYVEAAQALARRIVREGGATISDRIGYGFRLCVSRPPRERELSRLVALYHKVREDYTRKPKDAVVMATVPRGSLPAEMEPIDLAAWTVVANVLLNLDEVFAKR